MAVTQKKTQEGGWPSPHTQVLVANHKVVTLIFLKPIGKNEYLTLAALGQPDCWS